MGEIQAIPTRYSGCFFRSRAEARWAVFFNYLGIRWEYEKEGFEFYRGRYLPDFWLVDLRIWFEVKATGQETEEEKKFCEDLCWRTEREVVMMFTGFSPVSWDKITQKSSDGGIGWHFYKQNTFYEDDYGFCQCPICSKIDLTFMSTSDQCQCLAPNKRSKIDYIYDSEQIKIAFEKARSARF